jgi:hypothetical protein
MWLYLMVQPRCWLAASASNLGEAPFRGVSPPFLGRRNPFAHWRVRRRGGAGDYVYLRHFGVTEGDADLRPSSGAPLGRWRSWHETTAGSPARRCSTSAVCRSVSQRDNGTTAVIHESFDPVRANRAIDDEA